MKNTKSTIFFLVIGSALLVQLMNPTLVRADDGAPPVLPAATEVVPTEAPAIFESTPTVDAPVAMDKEPTALEIIQEISAQTEIVVLNEAGEIVPLATQEAANIIASSDPIWCPDGQKPGAASCTTSYPSLGDLLTNEGVYINSQTISGTIWMTSGAIAEAGAVSIDGLTYTNWANYALTLQGGWDGVSDSNGVITVGAPSTFNVPINITNWKNNVTLGNITVSGTTGKEPGIAVTTTGDITLNNIDSSKNEIGAKLDNTSASGTGDVTLNGTNVFNENNDYGLYVKSAGNIMVNNITASGNPGWYGGVILNNTSGTGDVTLNGMNVFDDNTYNGLYVGSNGDITTYNITASGNGIGVELDASGTGNVTVNGTNVFNTNTDIGLLVISAVNVTANNITANDNKGGGYGTGLYVVASGNISLSNITANNNSVNGIYLFTPGSALIEGINYTGNGVFDLDASDVCANMSQNNTTFNTFDLPANGWHTNSFTGKKIYCEAEVYINGVLVSGGALQHQTSIEIIVNGVTEFDIDCRDLSVFDALLPNNDRVKIFCPVSGRARISRLDNTTLPADLPAGYNYVSAFSLDIFQNGKSIPYISEGGYIDASFKNSSLEAGDSYSILYWDNGKWIPLKDFMLDENGEPRGFALSTNDPRKIISGINFTTVDGSPRVEVSANFPGIFVLAQH